ncbi:SDR family oxidoreductase [Myxococcota bacterium]|nr:SDR family oxidoreductase [Myxococcota bacterium]
MGALSGKVAIVTGAGQGVGRGIALALASEGCAIVVAGRTQAKLVDVCGEIEGRGSRALPVVCDVGHGDQIEACLEATLSEFGGVDILINNAQVVPFGTLLELDENDFQQGWQTGPLATWRFMKACHPHLREGGCIVNLGTGAALRPDPVGYGAYAAVKEAIRSLTRAAAVEWGPDGIRVNAIIPLATSPGLETWIRERPEESSAFLATVPLGRPGELEADIGRAVVMLVGPDSAYITGTTLMLDGGQAYLR